MNLTYSIFFKNIKQINVFLFSLLFSFLSIQVQAQISQGGKPESFRLQQIDEHEIVYSPAIPFSQTKSQTLSKQATAYEFGKILPLNKRLGDSNFGKKTIDSEGNSIWKASITSENALALGLYFSNFYLPKGAKLFVYSPDKKQVIGAFTELNNSETYLFATELILGDKLIIEYDEPAEVTGQGHFTIDEVLHAYRGINDFKNVSNFGSSGSCEVNVNCSEGTNYTNQRNSVVRLLIKEGNSSFWCTGSVINNVKNDRTPYVLTADHCGADASSVDLGQWMFYFNYQSETCSNPGAEPAKKTMTGATKIAASSNSGTMGSDFFLILLNQKIPDEYKPYFMGWDRTGNGSTNGVSIHHPEGDIKKISTYNTSLLSSTYNYVGAATNASWEVTWSATENGYGVTEPGSSGCPIYSQNGYLIGTLTGGSASCYNQYAEDYYGKFNYHWDKNGTSPDTQLKPWLDPNNTGIQTIQGIYCETDTIPPIFTAPSFIIINCEDDPYDLLITGDVLNEQDNCAVNQATYSDNMDDSNPCEIVITRTWSLSDNSGNSAADQIQTIIIKDKTAPTFTPPNDIIINCGDDAKDLNITGDVIDENDNCDDSFLDATYTDVYSSSANSCSALITRTWILSDNCNNTTTHNQIIQISNNFYTVFPNPSNGLIKIRFNVSAFGKTLTIRVINRLGQSVYEDTITVVNQIEINLQYFQKGIYFIDIEGDTQSQTQKISIQ